MAKAYRPSVPYNVPMKLLTPATTSSYGAGRKIYPAPEDVEDIFYGSFRTFGGTENVKDGVYTIVNTAVVDTWYRPDITADCQIYLCETGQIYDIISDPEDINFWHQYLQFKVRKIGGKA